MEHGPPGLGIDQAGRALAIHMPAFGEAQALLAPVGEHPRDRLLIAVKDIDAEMGDALHRAVHGGGLVDADEQARRVQRQRRHGGGGDTHRLAAHADGDDVHRRGNSAHRVAQGIGDGRGGVGHRVGGNDREAQP